MLSGIAPLVLFAREHAKKNPSQNEAHQFVMPSTLTLATFSLALPALTRSSIAPALVVVAFASITALSIKSSDERVNYSPPFKR